MKNNVKLKNYVNIIFKIYNTNVNLILKIIKIDIKLINYAI